MELMSGVDADHKLDPNKGYSLCGVDTYQGNLQTEWRWVNCWECRAIADKWDGVTVEDMDNVTLY